MAVMYLEMSRFSRDHIIALSEDSAPREACGLIVDDGGMYLEAVSSANVSTADDEYAVDPRTQLAWAGKTKGVWHSHVEKTSIPSDVDFRLAVPGLLYVIYSVRYNECCLWELVEGQVRYGELIWRA